MGTANEVDLGEFEGRDVIQSSIKVTKAGDGLSKAMTLKPVVLHYGDEVTIVLRCVVGPIIHKGIKDTDVLERVQTLIAGTAAIVDDKLVKKMLDEQERLILEAKGISALPGMGKGEEPD